MFTVKTMNKIVQSGLDLFDPGLYSYSDDAENPDAILVRSASLHDMQFESGLKAIARAGAGTNNIPVDRCSEQGIVVFNTPGANANAVKELVLLSLLISSRKVVPAITWAQTLKGKGDEVPKLVEKGKSQFAGPELTHKTLGVQGLGAVGSLVANSAQHLGMTVLGYDKFLSVERAWGLSRSVKNAKTREELYAKSDYLALHVPATADNKNIINAETIAQMKDGVRIINFSRAEIVNDMDMIAALKSGKVACYVTDFPNDTLLGVDGVVAIPHLGASTPESEDNCAHMAVEQLADFLENGNIVNSVNLPNVSLERGGHTRVTLIHLNKPDMIGKVSKTFSAANINIENLVNKSRGDYAYSIYDVNSAVTPEFVDSIQAIDGVIRTTVL